VKPAAFAYHAPRTIDEALALLGEWGPREGRVLAGGQSLVPAMALRLATPSHLIDINEIEALRVLRAENGWLRIGAGVRHSAFERSGVEGPLGVLLATVVRHIAHHPIRTRGTFCGSLAHADPSSEWCLVAATLDATIMAKSVRGERAIPARDFFEGMMSTALTDDELLSEVRIPLLTPDTRFGFQEFSRRTGDFAMAASLVTWRSDAGKMRDVRVGVGGAEPSPRRIAEAEASLDGQAPSDAAFHAAAEAAATAVEAMEDHQTTAEYRRDLVRAMVRRALEQSAK
jgi:aerobic carbon-monoxide dehydrogenase medium subunit